MNKHQELFHVKKHKMNLDKTILHKKTLIELLKKYRNYQNKLYLPLSILKYNITLEPQYIHDYISDPESFNFLNAESSIEDIDWFKMFIVEHKMD